MYNLEKDFEEICSKPFPYFRKISEEEHEVLGKEGSLYRWYYNLLMSYGNQCKHITEIGVNGGKSGKAWLMCKPKKLVGIDIRKFDVVKDAAATTDTEYEFICGDSLALETIDQTDLLFLDGNHAYKHVLEELRRFSCKVSKYLLGDDISAEGLVGPTGYGVLQAFTEFLEETNEWVLEHKTFIGGGLIVLKRKN